MTTTTLKCTGPADLVAALPKLAGFTATDSLYLVIFRSGRAEAAARVDLPNFQNYVETIAWFQQVSDLAVKIPAHAVALIAQTSDELGDTPQEHEVSKLMKILTDAIIENSVAVYETIVVGTDGWTARSNSDATLRPLTEISDSDHYDAGDGDMTLEEWRQRHQAQSSDDLDYVATQISDRITTTQ